MATKKSKKSVKKTKFIPASELADQMGLTVRMYARNCVEDPKRMVLRAPGTSEEDKKLLIEFMKRTGLRMIFHGRERKRYVEGRHHYLVFLKTADFDKAKAKLIPPPVAPKQDDEDYGRQAECAERNSCCAGHNDHFRSAVETVAGAFDRQGNRKLCNAVLSLLG